MSIKPIETRYAGCRFRSRLEARWAVFFDHAQIPWEYEPEGFDLDSGYYLPDFRLNMNHPDGPLWFEVKSPTVRVDEINLDPRWGDLVEGSGRNLTIMFGMHRNGDACRREFTEIEDGARRSHSLGMHWGMTLYPDGRLITTSPLVTGLDFEGSFYMSHQADIKGAWDAASSARFEHGERG